jgi:hypothetical protein
MPIGGWINHLSSLLLVSTLLICSSLEIKVDTPQMSSEIIFKFDFFKEYMKFTAWSMAKLETSRAQLERLDNNPIKEQWWLN